MMPLRNNYETYGIIARCFHWVMALAILFMLALGLTMKGMPFSPDKLRLYGIHKSIGALILGAAFLRLAWRFLNIAPAMPATIPRWQQWAAHGTHAALYLLFFALPLTGWMLSSAAGFPVSVFGWFTLPNLISPDKALHEFFEEAHEVLAFTIMGLIALHILAALKHHFIDRDTILRRMLLLFPLAVLMATPLHAAEKEPKQWFMIPAQSKLEFIATQNDAPIKGSIKMFSAQIKFSPELVEKSSVRVGMNLQSIHMDYGPAEQAIKSPDWLDVEKMRFASFNSTRITHSAKNNYVAEGNLSLHGVTIPVILHFTLEEYGPERTRVKGDATLSRSNFKIGSGEWATSDIVKDDVTVNFDITAQNTPPFIPQQPKK